MYFSGFTVVIVIYRLLIASKIEGAGSTVFGNFYSQRGKPGVMTVDRYYFLNLAFRVALQTCSVYSQIKSIHYAILANINFGIVSCCFIFSIVINTAFGYKFFGEMLNNKVLTGIFVTISGIIWISLAKGQRVEVPQELHES